MTRTNGQRAFEAYNRARGGLTHDGKPIPGWESVGEGIRDAWEAAASAVAMSFAPLIRTTRELAEDVGYIPSWVDAEAGVELPRDIAKDAIHRCTQWRDELRAPTNAAELIAWMCATNRHGIGSDDPDEAPSFSFDRDKETGEACVTNGFCMLFVRSGVPDIDFVMPRFWRKGVRDALWSVTKPVAEVEPKPISLYDMERWVSDGVRVEDKVRPRDRTVAIGTTCFDGELVEEWVFKIARIQPGPMELRAGPKVFVVDGPGWTVAISALTYGVTPAMPQLFAGEL